MIRTLEKMLGSLRTRVANMVARAVVQNVDDSTKMQLLQLVILDGETRDEVERFQNYGFTSVPRPGAEAAVMFVGGSRGHGLILAVDDRRFRLHSLESGEVAVYDDLGSTIVLKRSGDIEITPSSGNLQLSGTLTATVDVVADGISLKSHKHSVSGTVSAAPGPVTFIPVGSTGEPS